MSPENDPICRRVFTPGLCLLRHRSAQQKLARGLSENERCAACPAVIEWIEENKSMTKKESTAINPEKPVKICSQCNKEPSFARGLCKKCYGQNRYRSQLAKFPVNKASKEFEANMTQEPTKPVPFLNAVFANPEYIAALERENKNLRQINTTLFDLVDQLRQGAAA